MCRFGQFHLLGRHYRSGFWGALDLEMDGRMKPYYNHAGIIIYHGDCREILPSLPQVDAVITDPPYGIAFVHGDGGGKLARSTKFNRIAVLGDDKPFDPTIWLVFPIVALWGANHLAHSTRSRLPQARDLHSCQRTGNIFARCRLESGWRSERPLMGLCISAKSRQTPNTKQD